MVASACLYTGCASDDPVPVTGILLTDLVGDWEATRAEFTSVNTNPVLQRAVIAEGGSGALVVASDGRFTLVISPLGEDPQLTTGQFSISNNLLEVVLDDDPTTTLIWDLQLSADILLLEASFDHDFAGDGSFQAASSILEFVRP